MILWLKKWGLWIGGAVVGLFVFLQARASGKRQERADAKEKEADDADKRGDAAQGEVNNLQARADVARENREGVECRVENEREAARTDDRSGSERMDDEFDRD